MAHIIRVVLTGAESTGKTTLAQSLAKHYGTVWAPEFLRQFVEEKGVLPVASDTPLIAEGHLEQEQHYLKLAHRLLFLDTDLISTSVYHRFYFDSPCNTVLSAAHRRCADLYLLMEPDIPWVPDPGQRDGPDTRKAIHQLLSDALQSLPHVRISGDRATRFRTAVQQVDALLHNAA